MAAALRHLRAEESLYCLLLSHELLHKPTSATVNIAMP